MKLSIATQSTISPLPRRSLALAQTLSLYQFKGLLLLVLIILLVARHHPASASTLDDLYNLFQVNLPPADIVILLDASQSMASHRYEQVRQAVIDFAPTLTDKDNLHLRVFGDTVSTPMEGRGDEAAHILDQFLPQEPLLTHTDIGLAILKGLEFLERDDASKFQALFLLTDGLHQPAKDSPYSRDFDADPQWQALKRRAYDLCLHREVFIYGFGIGRQTDISMLRRIFPAENVEVIVGGSSQLALALGRVRDRLRRAQLRKSVEQEIAGGAVNVRLTSTSISTDASSFDIAITIHNAYQCLPVIIEKIQLQREPYSGGEILCEIEGDSGNILLEPGQQWQGRIKGSLDAETPPFRIGKARQPFHTIFNFVPVVRFQHEDAIEAIAINSIQPLTNTASLTVDLHRSYGISYSTLAGLTLMLAMALAAITTKLKRAKQKRDAIRQRLADRKRLIGLLKIWPAQQDEPEDRAFDLGEHHREKLYLVVGSANQLEISPDDAPSGEIVARLSGRLIAASPGDGESGRQAFLMEVADGHALCYESGGQMLTTASLVLCDNDLLEIDGQWRLRYINHRLRTRAEAESAQIGGTDNV